jgi:hypothetical protein
LEIKGEWKEIEKVHEMFCERVFGVPINATNEACVRELGRTNRKEKVVERIENIGKDYGTWMRRVC